MRAFVVVAAVCSCIVACTPAPSSGEGEEGEGEGGEGEGTASCSAASTLAQAHGGLAIADDAALTSDSGACPGGASFLLSVRVIAAGAPSTWSGAVAAVALGDVDGAPKKTTCDGAIDTLDVTGNACDGTQDCLVSCTLCYTTAPTDLAAQLSDANGDVSNPVCVATP